MKRLILGLAAAVLGVFWTNAAFAQTNAFLYCPTGSSPAWAPCSVSNPLNVTGTVSATVNFPTIGAAVPSTGVYMGVNVGGTLVGFAPGTAGSAATQVLTVQGIAGMTPLTVSPNFQLAPTITVQNAAYSAGNSLGGTITVTGAARTNGGTGLIDAIRLKSTGASTNTIWIYAWSKTPAATCTDKSAFVPSATDNPYALPGFPLQTTLGNAPGSWDTATYAQISGLLANFKNQDVSPGTAVYLCLVTAASVTPAATSDLTMIVGGVQD